MNQDYMDAYNEYVARQRREIRPKIEWIKGDDRFPIGFVLAQEEHCKCCDRFKTDQPQKIAGHMRSIEHVAHLHGLDVEPFSRFVVSTRIKETKKKRQNMSSNWKPNL